MLGLGLGLIALLARGIWGQLKILLPAELASDASFEGGVLYGTTAVFGTPSYGHRMIGRLFYAEMDAATLGCDPKDFAGFPEKPAGDTKAFVLVRRGGGCTFVRKAHLAEQRGFDGVIVVDTTCAAQEAEARAAGKTYSHCRNSEDVQRIIMASDGNGEEVRIPSILVAAQQGEKVIESVKRSSEAQPVLSMLLWDLPRSAGKPVTVDLWMSTGAADAMSFLRKFHDPLTLLKDKVAFTPHFYVIEMQVKLPGCLEATVDNKSRFFCDPLMSSDAVIKEDLRQLCIFKMHPQPVYWKYVSTWFDKCHFASPANAGDRAKLLDDTCSNAVLAELRLAKPELDTTRCSAALLAEEAARRAWSSHALQINGWRYSGPLDADAVTRNICAAFTDFPDECDDAIKDKMPTISHSASLLFWLLICVVPFLALAAWGYKFHVQKSLYRSLREEVMLEVRAQIQDYALLSDPPVATTKHTQGSGGAVQLTSFVRKNNE